MSSSIDCITCKAKAAKRLCKECGENTTQCDQCYLDLHSRGQRKRHSFARIEYAQVEAKSIPERDSTFAGSNNVAIATLKNSTEENDDF